MIKLMIYLISVFFLTAFVFFVSGVKENNFWNSPRLYQARPVSAPAVQIRPVATKDNSPSLFFRFDEARTGFTSEAVSPYLEPRYISAVENFEIHAASKSSPLPLEDGYILATDYGLLAKVTENSEVTWSLKTNTSLYGFHGTPALWGNSILVGDYKGLFYSVEKNSGKLQWVLQLGNTFGASPLLTHDGDVIVSAETSNDGFVAKINATTGKIKWLSPWLKEQSHSSPARSGEIVVVGDNGSHFSALNDSDGSFLWRYKAGGPIKSTPSIADGHVYFSSWDGFIHVLELKTGFLVRKIPVSAFNQSSTALLTEKKWGFIVTHQGLCRFDLDKESAPLCENKSAGRFVRMASPIVTKSAHPKFEYLVWASCDDNNFCVYDAKNMKRIKTWNLPSPSSGEARVYRGRVMIMTQKNPGLVIFE